ncbi:MAG: hypothetical protein OES26_25180 [Gammaproteobacteria bacterium]|nr:hypothetical protein [Gammaproteobacteria bacterium]
MDSAKLNDWMQVVGIFAVVASLIFVGLEMRQSQRIALSAAYQARADSSMHLRMAPLESEALQSAWAKAIIGGESLDGLTPEEIVVLRSRWNATLVYIENMHYQFTSGFVTEEQWQSNRRELEMTLTRIPEWGRQLLENCDVYRDSFCEEIREAGKDITTSGE